MISNMSSPSIPRFIYPAVSLVFIVIITVFLANLFFSFKSAQVEQTPLFAGSKSVSTPKSVPKP